MSHSYETEKEIQKYWDQKEIPTKVREKDYKKNYYFIDGPPYASGNIHLGTCFNRILKDIIIRYKRQTNHKVLDTPGFDTHGVPVEMKVQKKYGLKSKDDIKEFGVSKFIEECKNFATKHIGDMSLEIYNLGQWMDWENPYKTLDKDYMLSAWWTFKKAADKGLLYKGKYPVHVCPECETTVSFNEIEHQELTDTSIFVPLESSEDKNKFYVIWTTTPWTLPSNLAIMVNPSYEYIEVKVEDKIYVIAKDLLEKLAKDFEWNNYEIINTYKGSELEGKTYKPILEEWLNVTDEFKQKAYKIVLSPRYVHLEEGTGLVHCAPGHGKEDYEIGVENNIPIFSPVTINGKYTKDVERFVGQKVKSLDPTIIDYLESQGKILFSKKVHHSYPTCWRCHSPLLQIALPEWFLETKKLKPRLLEINNDVSWFPSWAKDRFNDWLNTISDWPFSRSRFWGTPIPIWECNKCKKIDIFGSLEELKEKVPNLDLSMDIHKPYIDEITYNCECGGTKKRIEQIFDVWFDSGVASWASIGYPKNSEKFNEFWPPDINIEGSDQIRGWWNSQLLTSVIVFDKAPFKHVSLHGMLIDESKKKLSKSLGNDKPLNEWFEQYSIDYLRYYFAREYDGTDLIVDEKRFKDIKRIFNLLSNIFNFIKIYDDNPKFIEEIKLDDLTIEDKWILSRLNNLKKKSFKNYNQTMFSKLVLDIESFVLEDFSRIYIKLIRKRENKNKVLTYVYSEILKLLSPITPFLTESLYLLYKSDKESIHLYFLTDYNKDLINLKLEEKFKKAQEIVANTLSLRENIKKRLRWILPRVVLKTDLDLKEVSSVIEKQANVEKVEFLDNLDNLETVDIDKVTIGLDKEVSDDYKDKWELSELKRNIQSFRKKQKLNPKDIVKISIATDDVDFLKTNKSDLEKSTNTEIEIEDNKDNLEKLINRSFFIKLL